MVHLCKTKFKIIYIVLVLEIKREQCIKTAFLLLSYYLIPGEKIAVEYLLAQSGKGDLGDPDEEEPLPTEEPIEEEMDVTISTIVDPTFETTLAASSSSRAPSRTTPPSLSSGRAPTPPSHSQLARSRVNPSGRRS